MDHPPTEADRQRQRREHWYLGLMLACVVILAFAWFLVRLWSTTAAIVLSLLAMLLPGVAVIVANRRRDDG
ncbi:MAG TPA: DUF3099 domain-containing protein [Segeticoccus sp.]|nr:DUF3099 domain-containing protein [Segeticoccus sp.]